MGIAAQEIIDFADRMAALGPFESSPHVALAVSGGADSMALALLADRWARDQRGRVTALTVDHGLRPEAADEAAEVGIWLKNHGIEHLILTWTGAKPATGVQAAARMARYRLMAAACHDAGILHLLTAHHLEDQAETFLLRLGRSSGIDGLAAMPAVLERNGIRLLRPLLQTPKDRLRVILKESGQDWIEDPSNDNRVFTRVRIRQSLPGLAAAGISVAVLAETAARMARARVALEAGTSALLGRCAFGHSAGYIELKGRTLFDAPEEISLRAVSRALLCVGGNDYPTSMIKLENLHEKMKAQFSAPGGWKGATLARCRVVPTLKGSFLVFREMRDLPTRQAIPTGRHLYWDRRFRIHLCGQDKLQSDHNNLAIAPLGCEGLVEIRAAGCGALSGMVPKPVLWTLPTLVDDIGVVQTPHLNYTRPAWPEGSGCIDQAIFFPGQSLSGVGFAIAE